MKLQALTLGLCALLAGAAVQAATFHVTRTDDPVPNGCLRFDCSLREAVIAANGTPGAHLIVLGSQTYSLTRTTAGGVGGPDGGGPLRISRSVQIQGNGVNKTRIRWNTAESHQNQVFLVDHPVSQPVALELADLSLSHGLGSQGGCIHMMITNTERHLLSLERVRVHTCSADFGGAAYLGNTNLIATDTTIDRNLAALDGGALHMMGATTVDSANLVIRDNEASRSGGGVYLVGNGIIGWHTDVIWRDGGGSAILNNKASSQGGGITVIQTSTLDIASLPSVASADWLQIRGNSASIGGGIALPAGLTNITRTNRFSRIRVLDNVAREGGGINVAVSLQMSDSEVAGNVARTGNGGGIALRDDFVGHLGRLLQRLSLHGNLAAGGGGAIHSGCGALDASDLSIHLNLAGAKRGQGIEVEGPALLRHLTLFQNGSHTGSSAPGMLKVNASQCPGTELSYGNSLITDACSTHVSGLVSSGGNQLGSAAGNCPALNGSDARQNNDGVFALELDHWGGAFEVVGWPASAGSVPQRDFGLPSQCSSLDALGRPRGIGQCDAGAFEQQDD